MSVIKDVPGWVENTQKRIDTHKEKLKIEEAERDENEKILILRNKLREFEEAKGELLGTMKEKIKKMKDELIKKDQQLKEYSKKISEDKKKEEENKGVKILEQIKKEESIKKKGDQLKLVDFLGI